MTRWMLNCLIEDSDVPNLWNVGILRHHLRSVPHQERTVVTGIPRSRAILRCEAPGFHS